MHSYAALLYRTELQVMEKRPTRSPMYTRRREGGAALPKKPVLHGTAGTWREVEGVVALGQ